MLLNYRVVRENGQGNGSKRGCHNHCHIQVGGGEQLVDSAEEELKTDGHDGYGEHPVNEGLALEGNRKRGLKSKGLDSLLLIGKVVLLQHKEGDEHRKNERKEDERDDTDVYVKADENGDKREGKAEVYDVTDGLGVGEEECVALILAHLGEGGVVGQHRECIARVEDDKKAAEPDGVEYTLVGLKRNKEQTIGDHRRDKTDKYRCLSSAEAGVELISKCGKGEVDESVERLGNKAKERPKSCYDESLVKIGPRLDMCIKSAGHKRRAKI